ncbi:GtrA family protein [Patescibacteria group bacterium]
MKPLIKKDMPVQFIKFGIVGISNTLIDLGIFQALTAYTPIYYVIANIISFSLGVLNSYIWNRIWTFRSPDRRISKEFIRFAIISVIGLVLNTLFLAVFIEVFNFPSFLGKVVATVLVFVWNFFMSKSWVFKTNE